MAKYAIVQISGKQYRVSEGQKLNVERLDKTDGQIELDRVLLVAQDGDVKIGSPIVSGVKVVAKVLGEEKGEKIRVVKFRAKSRYRRTTGFRPIFTTIEILRVENGVSPKKMTSKKASVK